MEDAAANHNTMAMRHRGGDSSLLQRRSSCNSSSIGSSSGEGLSGGSYTLDGLQFIDSDSSAANNSYEESYKRRVLRNVFL